MGRVIVKLKYPECEECKILYSINVENKQINELHEDKITIAQLPKLAQRYLKRWRTKKGYLVNGGDANAI